MMIMLNFIYYVEILLRNSIISSIFTNINNLDRLIIEKHWL